jgi:hypothetical protein
MYKTMKKPVLMSMTEKDKVKLSAWEWTVTAQGNWRNGAKKNLGYYIRALIWYQILRLKFGVGRAHDQNGSNMHG